MTAAAMELARGEDAARQAAADANGVFVESAEASLPLTLEGEREQEALLQEDAAVSTH